MTDIIPVTGGVNSYVQKRQDRALSRQLSELDRRVVVGLARLEQQAQLQANKAHAVGYVGQQALQAVAMVSQLEVQLGQTVPAAVTRLQGVADMTALAIAQVVADTSRKLG